MKLEIKPEDEGFCFNPSICIFKGTSLIAYRNQVNDFPSRIKIGKYTGSSATNCKVVEIPSPALGTDLFEDPRLFVHNDELWLSFIAAGIKQGRHYAAQGVALLDEHFQPKRIFYPTIGDNVNEISSGNGLLLREKNWTFFSFDGKIHVVYSINPLKVGVMCPNSGEVDWVGHSRFDHPWKWGDVHGSCGFIDWEGKLLGCFHSFNIVDNQRKYYVGFYLVDPKEWKVTHISSDPWMEAERNDKLDRRPFDQTYRPNVIFPCGMYREEEKIFISYGWQDCRSYVEDFPLMKVINSLKKVSNHLVPVQVIRDPLIRIPGGFKCQIGTTHLYGKNWLDLKRQAKKNNISEIKLHGALINRLPDHRKEIQWVACD